MDEDIVIGIRWKYGGDRPFGLSVADGRQHLYTVGKTGSGKSTLLKNILLQHIDAGRGVALIDPHGDMAEEILGFIPPHRSDDVVYFNPSDLEHPIGINVLAHVPPDQRHLVASGIVGSLKSLWRESWGPRMEYILHNALASLLECENVSLLGVNRLLVDARYRRWVVAQVKDPILRSFWFSEFERYEPRFQREAIAPIQNKLGQFFTSAPIRNILGQVKAKIDFGFMMNNKRIFLANLSKGQIGEDKANLLGAILITQFQLAAMDRAAVPEEERKDMALVIDEVHNFTTDSLATILSEARKYRLSMTLSHQYIDQVPDTIRAAIFGNVGTVVAFRVGYSDAEVLAKEFGNAFPPGEFSGLENHEVIVKLLNNGMVSEPFFGKTLPPRESQSGRRRKLMELSRQKYAARRAVVEEKIARWMSNGLV